jgi:hypothetical protein
MRSTRTTVIGCSFRSRVTDAAWRGPPESIRLAGARVHGSAQGDPAEPGRATPGCAASVCDGPGAGRWSFRRRYPLWLAEGWTLPQPPAP